MGDSSVDTQLSRALITPDDLAECVKLCMLDARQALGEVLRLDLKAGEVLPDLWTQCVADPLNPEGLLIVPVVVARAVPTKRPEVTAAAVYFDGSWAYTIRQPSRLFWTHYQTREMAQSRDRVIIATYEQRGFAMPGRN
jgi:hypothetical protein